MPKLGENKTEDKQKRIFVSQTLFPNLPLESALRISQALWDNFAGKGAAPHDVAIALGVSPTSGGWRNLCGTSIAYGLTEGGYNAKEIFLTDLGRKLVAPTEEGDVRNAKVAAILRPKLSKAFFEKYDRAKFPQDQIAQNVLVSLGLPKERTMDAVEILKTNGSYAGIIRETPTGQFVALDTPSISEKAKEIGKIEQEVNSISDPDVSGSGTREDNPSPPKTNRVYISHGKNRSVVEQVKEILRFGKFEPVVSVEKGATAVPVPEKVFDDMRLCSAGVIHVMKEGEYLDPQGTEHPHINDNVLIEIGAAMALYGKNFVLLVQKGTALPSNLQGLYRIEYEGDKLDYNATMQLLKTFNEFK